MKEEKKNRRKAEIVVFVFAAQRWMEKRKHRSVCGGKMPIYYCKLQILQIEKWKFRFFFPRVFFFTYLLAAFSTHSFAAFFPFPQLTVGKWYTQIRRVSFNFGFPSSSEQFLAPLFLIWFLIVFQVCINSFLRLGRGFVPQPASLHAVTADWYNIYVL